MVKTHHLVWVLLTVVLVLMLLPGCAENPRITAVSIVDFCDTADCICWHTNVPTLSTITFRYEGHVFIEKEPGDYRNLHMIVLPKPLEKLAIVVMDSAGKQDIKTFQ